jgi:hypothetical protein
MYTRLNSYRYYNSRFLLGGIICSYDGTRFNLQCVRSDVTVISTLTPSCAAVNG